MMAGHPDVKGRCPACGSASLFLGSGGYVTCRIYSCSNPGAAADLLLAAEPPKPVTRVVVGDDVWNLAPGRYDFDGRSFAIPVELRRVS